MASSRSSSFQLPSPTQIRADHQISLLDTTVSSEATPRDRSRDAERVASAPPTPGPADTPGGLYKRATNTSLSIQQSIRREINKQKYARYGQDRYDLGEDPAVGSQARPDAALAHKSSYLEQAHARAKAILKRKKTLGRGREAEDTAVDVLYENQRGLFFFGIPKYSSNSLLPTDPKPWQNVHFRTSACDIRNAQVPDPSWEWAWTSWYVDMSRDVDEEGWEYSFAFAGKNGSAFAWHGTHPWFHSFVRRRRWLRMRKRRDLHAHQTKEKGHALAADYFTIHPKTMRAVSIAGSQGPMSVFSPGAVAELDVNPANMEIITIGDLFSALRVAAVDREKLAAVRKFIDHGSDELFYLSERMPDIMSLLVFQSSRRVLLSDLITHHEEAHRGKERLDDHRHDNDDDQQREHDTAARRAENLLNAIHAADEQVKKLEFWSDIKGVSGVAAESGEEGHDVPSFKNKQPAKDGVPELCESNNGHGVPSPAPSQQSSAWFDARSRSSKMKSSEDTDQEPYVSAESGSERTSRTRGKEKKKPSPMDGVAEEEEEHARHGPENSGEEGANGGGVQAQDFVAGGETT